MERNGCKPFDSQASHLCHHSTCTSPGHVYYESGAINNSRKGCQVWCESFCCDPTCTKKLLVCPHRPMCIKEIPGVPWDEWDECPSDFIKYPSSLPLNHTPVSIQLGRLKATMEDSTEGQCVQADPQVANAPSPSQGRRKRVDASHQRSPPASPCRRSARQRSRRQLDGMFLYFHGGLLYDIVPSLVDESDGSEDPPSKQRRLR